MDSSKLYTLKRLEKDGDWSYFHDIRETILFEGRGRFGVYDRNHPDDRKRDNHPLLFLLRGKPIGAVRVDINRAEQYAFMRLVAIVKDEQGKGHGAMMVKLVEEFAIRFNCKYMKVVPAADARGFYRKCGYGIIEPVNGKPLMMERKLPA